MPLSVFLAMKIMIFSVKIKTYIGLFILTSVTILNYFCSINICYFYTVSEANQI